MKRVFVLVSLLLPGLMLGCASDKDLQAVRADAQALERQSSERQQTVEARLQNVSDRVAQFEKSQAETRRDLARTTATLDELRTQLQRLQGDIQETQHRVRRGTTGGEGISATKLADFETRLSELEKQFPAQKSATPPVPQQKPEQERACRRRLHRLPPRWTRPHQRFHCLRHQCPNHHRPLHLHRGWQRCRLQVPHHDRQRRHHRRRRMLLISCTSVP